MNFPYRVPFRIDTLRNWVATNRPEHVAMTDSQYSWYASLMRENKKDVDGVPIKFLDQRVVQ